MDVAARRAAISRDQREFLCHFKNDLWQSLLSLSRTARTHPQLRAVPPYLAQLPGDRKGHRDSHLPRALKAGESGRRAPGIAAGTGGHHRITFPSRNGSSGKQVKIAIMEKRFSGQTFTRWNCGSRQTDSVPSQTVKYRPEKRVYSRSGRQ
jgi:hypothetical protein